MENENTQTELLESPFSFLEYSDVQPHFADLNIDLLKSRHIQRDDFYSFQLLSKYFSQIGYYYRALYQLELVRDKVDGEQYFYLDFLEEGKGKVSDTARHVELNSEVTVFGIILLHMYYDRYFTEKEIRWEDISKEIMESDNRDLYKMVFFGEVRAEYSDIELDAVRKIVRKAIREFNKLGWIKRLVQDDNESIHFIIKPSIHRLAKLYSKEIEGFDQFSQTFSFKKDE